VEFGAEPAEKWLYMRWRLGRDLNGAAALHFTSGVERDLTGPLGLRPRGIVEPNGLIWRSSRQLPSRGTFRGQYAQIGERPMVLFLSRLHYKKGLDLLIPAFAKTAATRCW